MQDKTWYSILGLDAEPLFLQDHMLKKGMPGITYLDPGLSEPERGVGGPLPSFGKPVNHITTCPPDFQIFLRPCK